MFSRLSRGFVKKNLFFLDFFIDKAFSMVYNEIKKGVENKCQKNILLLH